MTEDVLDEIYYIISDFVRLYTYLKSWILTEAKTQRKIILGDGVQDWIPAQNIFKENTFWQVDFL